MNESNTIIIPDEIPIAHRLVVFCSGSAPVLGNFGVTPVLVKVGVAKHVDPVIVFVSNVTAPVCAKARPFKLALVAILIEVRARILPVNTVLVPIVAELTTLHQTLQGSPPTTEASPEVVKADADLKIQTSPVDPFSVSVPVKLKSSAQ